MTKKVLLLFILLTSTITVAKPGLKSEIKTHESGKETLTNVAETLAWGTGTLTSGAVSLYSLITARRALTFTLNPPKFADLGIIEALILTAQIPLLNQINHMHKEIGIFTPALGFFSGLVAIYCATKTLETGKKTYENLNKIKNEKENDSIKI